MHAGGEIGIGSAVASSRAEKEREAEEQKLAMKSAKQIKDTGGISKVRLSTEVAIKKVAINDISSEADLSVPLLIGDEGALAKAVMTEELASVNFICYVMGFPNDMTYAKGKSSTGMAELDNQLKTPLRAQLEGALGAGWLRPRFCLTQWLLRLRT